MSPSAPPQDSGGRCHVLQTRLAGLEQQILLSREHFAHQLEVVTGIERVHGDSASARKTLRLMAQAHVVHLDQRERLRRLLEGALD